MAPGLRRPGIGYRIRRTNPLVPLMRADLARVERAGADRIRAYQDRRLRALVRFAAVRSPFYRRWFRESGVDPASVRTVDDLHRLPLLERADLASDPERFLAYPRRAVWPARSNGTSGTVVTAYRSPGSSVYEMCALERQWGWFGLGPSARRAVLRGADAADRDGAVTALRPSTGQLMVSSFHLMPDRLPESVAALDAFAPDAMEGWPSSLTRLAVLLREAGRDLPVRAVITSSEMIGEHERALLRDVFHGPVVDHYGQTERVAMAGTCEHGSTHVFPDYGIVELLPVGASGERFEIVGTPLHNWAFPLLRYRTGDEVTAPPDGPCPCGRAFPLLGTLDGRVEDAFTASDGRFVPLPHVLVMDLTGLREVQVAQRAAGEFEFRMAPGPDADLPAVRARALANVERYVGPGQTVTFREVDRVPRAPSGKVKPAVREPGG